MAEIAFQPRPAFAALIEAAGTGTGVVVSERVGLGLATVQARAGQAALLRERVLKLHGVEPPAGPGCAATGPVAFVGTGPNAWLAIHDSRPNDFAHDLSQDLNGLASVADQSDGYAVLRLGGPKVRDALAKGFTIDLHPAAFPPGSAAVTQAAHIGVILWRPPGPADEAPFDVAMFRSYAGSFWHWLSASAAEFGLTRRS